MELARKAGLAYEVAINLHILGESLFRSEDHPRAYACFQQSTALCEEIAEERLRAHNRSFLAYLDAVTYQQGAYTALGESASYARAHNYAWDEVNARFLLARLYQKKGKNDEARAEFERCRRLTETLGFRLIDEDCRVALAELPATPRLRGAGCLALLAATLACGRGDACKEPSVSRLTVWDVEVSKDESRLTVDGDSSLALRSAKRVAHVVFDLAGPSRTGRSTCLCATTARTRCTRAPSSRSILARSQGVTLSYASTADLLSARSGTALARTAATTTAPSSPQPAARHVPRRSASPTSRSPIGYKKTSATPSTSATSSPSPSPPSSQPTSPWSLTVDGFTPFLRVGLKREWGLNRKAAECPT